MMKNSMGQRSPDTPNRNVFMILFAFLVMAIPATVNAAETLGSVRILMAQGALGDWSPYVAKELGYFADEGVDVEIIGIARQNDVATALISGRGEISISSLPTVLTAALSGAPMRMISATQRATPSGGYNNWWAVLPNSPIQKPADLKGKTVDIYAQNSLAQVVTRQILAGAGVSSTEYNEVSLPFPQSYVGLESKLADISIFIEPFFTSANELSKQKYGQPLRVIYTYLDEFHDGLELSGMMVNPTLASRNPAAIRAFLRATTRAAKWGNAHHAELKPIIAKYAGVPYELVKDMIPAEMSEDGIPIPGMFEHLQALIMKYQMIPGLTEPLKPASYLDLSYLPTSVSK